MVQIKHANLHQDMDRRRSSDEMIVDLRVLQNVGTVELYQFGLRLPGLPIIRIGLVLRVNVSRILQT